MEENTNQNASQSAAETPEIDKKYKDFIERIEKLTVLELAELVKVLEKRFGVSASAMAVAAPGAGSGEGEAAEKTAYNVVLKEVGGAKINVIKVVKEITGLGLKEAKDLVDGAPKAVKEGLQKDEAEEIRKKLEAAGAVVSLE